MAPAAGTVMLSSTGKGSDSTMAHASASDAARGSVGRKAIRRVQAIKAVAASVPKSTKVRLPYHPLFLFHGSLGPPTEHPTMVAMPSPKASTPQIAAVIHM